MAWWDRSDKVGVRWPWAPIQTWWCWRMRSRPARLCCYPGLSCDRASWKGACCSWRVGPSQHCCGWIVGPTGHRCAGLCSLARPAGSSRSPRVSARARRRSRAPIVAGAAVRNTLGMRDGNKVNNKPKRSTTSVCARMKEEQDGQTSGCSSSIFCKSSLCWFFSFSCRFSWVSSNWKENFFFN